jgi:glycosyltransferase involved in cell wall biosynthesis
MFQNYREFFEQFKLITLTPNQGRGAARDTGVKNATGEFIAFIDADIILPPNWLSVCFEEIVNYDAVGGIAVPDGDINYIYSKFNLKPKIVNQSTIITGNNGLYRRKLFSSVVFDRSFQNGEDSAINLLFLSNGYKLKTIKSLIVDHRESKVL